MLVKELIEKLKVFNPDSKIAFHSCIECGMSTVECEGGEMTLDYDEENDEVFLEVSGEETDWC
jgi:ferredoxin-like protein FixX